MATIAYMVDEEDKECATAVVQRDTRACVAAELRSRGLSVIAATLEGVIANHVCGVIQPGHEEQWRQAMETDIVDLVKRRCLTRELPGRQGQLAECQDPHLRARMI